MRRKVLVRAARDQHRATADAASAIVFLLLAVGFLYRKNGRLLKTSQPEALFDPLTGLRNHRALRRGHRRVRLRRTTQSPPHTYRR